MEMEAASLCSAYQEHVPVGRPLCYFLHVFKV